MHHYNTALTGKTIRTGNNKMSYFDWTPDLDTHIELVDEQHKILVRCINELHEANQRKDFEAEGKIIEDLIRYTVEHFFR